MKIHVKNNDVLFYAAFILYYIAIFVTYLPFEDTSMAKKGLSLVTCMCLALNLVPEMMRTFRFSFKSKILTLVCIAVALASIMLKDFFLIVVYLFGCNIYIRGNDTKPVIKLSFYLLTTLTIITILLCMVGVIENVVTARNGVARYSLGFYHSNVLPLIILYLCMYYHIFKKSITLPSFVIFEFVSIIAFIICDSRNAFLALQFFLILAITVKKFGKSRKYVKFLRGLAIISVPVIAGLSLLLFYLYDNGSPVAIALNDLFNNRIHMVALYYHYQEFRLLNLMTTDYFSRIILTLDNGYYYSVARYGVVFLFAIFAVFVSLTRGAYKRNNGYYLCAITVIAAVNFIDNGFFSFLFYPFILEGIYYFRNRKNKEESSAEYLFDKIKASL